MKRNRCSVELGGVHYRLQKGLQKKIKARFDEIRDSTAQAWSIAKVAFMCDLATYHPKLKDCQIVSAQAGKAKGKWSANNAVWVCFTRKGSTTPEWDTFSHKSPAQAAMNGNAVATLQYANDCIDDNLRLAVEPQCQAKKASVTTDGKIKCVNCHADFSPHKCDIDHGGGDHLTFKALVTGFCKSELEADGGFSKENYFGRLSYDPAHVVVTRWQTYHQENASLQPLCKPCHWKKSGEETSRRKSTGPTGDRK